jgi:hypothetical protein
MCALRGGSTGTSSGLVAFLGSIRYSWLPCVTLHRCRELAIPRFGRHGNK